MCGFRQIFVNVRISSVFDVPVIVRLFLAYLGTMDFVSFWRNGERMGFVSSVFGVRCERMAFVSFWRTCECADFVSF